MSYYLIGIGGTGAKCLESFVYLCGAGLLQDSQPVKMVFVDADVSCGNLQRTQKAVDLYNKAKSIGFGDTGLFKNAIDAVDPWNPVPEDCDTLDQVFKRTILISKPEYKELGYLYDCLFSEQERTTTLDKGFRGHPAIGAAVMSQSMEGSRIESWEKLEQEINNDKDARIFLFASVFGGTGAAGFPTIARILKNRLKKDSDGKSMAKIGGALILPYFQFPPASADEEKEMQAKVSEFMLNTKSALDYYDKAGLLGDVFNSIYMIGDNDLTDMKEFSLGSKTQKNDSHFIEIYAALAATDFFNKNDFSKPEAPMIARGDETEETKDKISWEDLPSVVVSGTLKDKLSAYIRFLYVYKHCILKNLEICANEEGAKKRITWYMDLLEKAGKIDVYNDKRIMSSFDALGSYTDEFLNWWKQIVLSNEKRKVELVNRQLWEDSVWENNRLDVYQVVLPITERKDKMNYQEFWKQLCNYTRKLHKTNASGAEILMSAAYELCTK